MSNIVTYNLDPANIGNSPLFSADVESNQQIGYHGTSSYYSNDIEANGFSLKKPIPVSDIDYVIDIGNRLAINTYSAVGFKELSSVSFAPISEMALFYVQPRYLGGQGLIFMSDLIQKITNSASGKISQQELDEVARIGNLISTIRSSDPVIYAVDMQGISLSRYDTVAKTVFVRSSVPANKIVGKLIVPHNINYSLIDMEKHKFKMRGIALSDEPHFIQTII